MNEVALHVETRTHGMRPLKSKYCGFRYHDETMFYKPSCGISESSLTRFRLFAAAFHWFILVLRSREVERLPMFCYLTNLVYLCCALYYSIAAYNGVMVSSALCGSDKPAPPVFRMDRVCYEGLYSRVKPHFIAQWLLHSVIANLGFLVSALYFILIYNPKTDILGLTNISRHLLNSVFIIIELTFNSIAIKFLHVFWIVGFTTIYGIYTLVFWYTVPSPENYIYDIVDWNRPAKTFQLIIVLQIVSVIIKLSLVASWKLKLRLWQTSKSRQQNPFLV